MWQEFRFKYYADSGVVDTAGAVRHSGVVYTAGTVRHRGVVYTAGAVVTVVLVKTWKRTDITYTCVFCFHTFVHSLRVA